jgi:hypothetical protein
MTVPRSEHQQILSKQGRISAATDWFRCEITAEKLFYWAFVGVFFSIPIGISPALVCGVMALLLWVLSGTVLRVKLFFGESWFWPLVAFVILQWVGLLYTPDLSGFGIRYAGKTYYWLFCLAIASLAFQLYRPEKFIYAFLAGLGINAVVGLAQLIGIVAPKQGWYSGFTKGFSSLSAFLVLGILMGSFYLRNPNQKTKRWGLLLLLVVYFVHLIILESRTGYLTLVLLSPLIVKNLFRRLNLLKAFLVCLLISGTILLSPIARNRVDLAIDQLKYHLNAEPDKAWGREYTEHQDRFYFWYGAVEIFLENPILGIGTGGYPTVLKERRNPSDPVIADPHNNLLYMAVSFGIVGILVFVWFFWEVLRNAIKQRDTIPGYFILCTALVLLVNGLLNTTILDAGPLFLLSVAVGLQRGLPKFAQEEKPAEPHWSA